MAKFSLPDPLDFTKPATWPDWKQRFSRYRVTTKLMKEKEKVQLSALIYAMGAEAEHIFKSLTFADPVLANFDTHFVPKRNVIYERAKFHSTVQQPGESVKAFVRQLYKQHSGARLLNKNTKIRICDLKRLNDCVLNEKSSYCLLLMTFSSN